MGMLLLEYHEKLQVKRREFYKPVYDEIVSQSEKLKQIAREQEQFLVA